MEIQKVYAIYSIDEKKLIKNLDYTNNFPEDKEDCLINEWENSLLFESELELLKFIRKYMAQFYEIGLMHFGPRTIIKPAYYERA